MKAGADMDKFEKAEAATKKEIDRQVFANKVELASNALGQMSEIMGKESAAGKAFAIAQTTIDTFVGAQAAFNSLASIPIVGSVLGAIAAAAAVAGGLARVNKIRSTSTPKMHDGGLVQGASHEQGGIQMYHKTGQHLGEMEGNEYIISAKRTREIGLANLDAMNFGKGTQNGFFASGGSVPTSNLSTAARKSASQQDSNEQLAELLTANMQQAIISTPVINNSVDTFDVARNVINTEQELSFG